MHWNRDNRHYVDTILRFYRHFPRPLSTFYSALNPSFVIYRISTSEHTFILAVFDEEERKNSMNKKEKRS
jgi:hypothetical protein